VTERSIKGGILHIIDIVLSHSAVNGSRFTIDGWSITPGCPMGILGKFFGLIRVCFASEKNGNDFDGLLAEK
jgi:hypothetical protein